MKKKNTHLIRYAMLGLFACGAIAASVSGVQAQDVSTSYRRAPKDPFVKYVPRIPVKVVKPGPKIVAIPSIQERINSYKAQKVVAMGQQQPAPKPTTALLLDELQVIGIFRTPRGYAAMVEATPIKLSYVVYPGETFFNGQLVAIEENRLVFRRETRWTDGRRDVAVDAKPLRKPSTVDDEIKLSKEAEKAIEKANAKNKGDKKNKEDDEEAPSGNQ